MTFNFSHKMWDDFDIITNNGKTPHLYKSVLPLNEGFSNWNTVQESFISLWDKTKRENIDCRIRVYDGDSRRDDLAGDIFNHHIDADFNIVSFMQELVKKERFSLVINNLEQSSQKLAADFGDFIRPFFESRGMPVGGIEQAAFCGNYAGTAFGIHEGFEHAFLCHLGPGVKHFYCWSQELYLSIVGSRIPTFEDSTYYQQLIKKGTLYVLEPGDVLYLPASVYHVGRQNDFSVSVALPLYTYPLSRLLALKVIPALAERTLPFDREGISEHFNINAPHPLHKPIGNYLNQISQQWLNQDLNIYLDFYWSRLLSNGGWELPSSIAADIYQDESLSPEIHIPLQSQVILNPPYTALLRQGLECGPEEVRVFIAGKSVVVPAESTMFEMTEILNSRKPVTVSNEQQLKVLSVISRTGGLSCV